MGNKLDRVGPAGLDDFKGRWRLVRVMDDHRAGIVGRLEGEAEFAPSPDGLIYDERGTLRYGDQPAVEAGRRYLWAQSPAGFKVSFADGRFFHSASFNGGEAAHFCDPDQYDVTYDFSDWPNWTAHWRVHGPRKDYEMTSHYARWRMPD